MLPRLDGKPPLRPPPVLQPCCSCRYIRRRLDRLPSWLGIEPVSLFLSSRRKSSLGMLPRLAGIDPAMSLRWANSRLSWAMPDPSWLEMPVRSLS